jgi:hypothetical protein
MIGPLDSSFIIELVAMVDKCKSDKNRAVCDAAYELDERIQFNKNAPKDKYK